MATVLANILVVDDDAVVRNTLCSVLGDEGYTVEAVEDGKKAIKACEKLPFDVALIDIKLPDMKGTELLSKLKKLHPKMIRIIVTGYPTLETAVKAVNERADGYVLKPFDVTRLLEMIRNLLAEKTNEYLSMMAENARAKDSAPTVKYQRPQNW